MEYRKEFELLSNACLNLTDDCNLRCKYCFVEQRPHYMTFELAKTASDFLVNNLHIKKDLGFISQNATAEITFFGGEPTLCWDTIIVPLVTYLETTYPEEVGFAITTNGTLLNEDKIKYLYDHRISPLLSIDGAPKTQDFNRPCKDQCLSSSELVLKNIPTLLKYFPNTTFRSTIDQESVGNTFENYIFAQYLGFKNIFMMPNCRSQWTEDQVITLQQEYRKIYDYIIENFRAGTQTLNCSLIDTSFEQVLKHDLDILNDKMYKKEVSKPIYRCGMGTSMGSIGYDGSIYGCQEQDSKDKKNIFYIGNIFEGINIEKHIDLLNTYGQKAIPICEDPNYCENCPLCSQCATFGCPSTVWDLYTNFYTDAKIHCQWLRIMFEEAARTMQILVAEDNQMFRHYLYNQCNFKSYWEDENNG